MDPHLPPHPPHPCPQHPDWEAVYRELREAEQKARVIFDSSFSLMGYLALDGTLLDVNHTALDMIGAKLADVIGQPFWDCPWWAHDPELQDLVRDAVQRGGQGEIVSFEAMHPTPHGEMRDIEFTLRPIRDEQGRVTALVPEGRDITPYRKIVRDLRDARERAEHYLRIAEVIVLARDTQGKITMLNPKGYAVLGYEPGELLGRDWFEVATPPDMIPSQKAYFQGVISGEIQKVDHIERTLICKDGTRRIIAWRNALIRDEEGVIQGVLSSGEDITERRAEEDRQKLLQAQILQAQKMESMGILAGGVAHDMNNVLAAIIGMAEIGLEQEVEGSSGARALETILKAADRGSAMVKSLLAFARRGPGEQHPLDLNAVISENTRLLERTTLSRVQLRLFLQPDLPVILGDPNAMASVFMNLCVNAVDAMPDGGTITFRTRNVQDTWVEVLVEDTGTGMPPEVLARALDPFFTTKEAGKGTGLGLSTVHSTVTAHKGDMQIESTAGVGTRITMKFPISSHTSAPPLPSWERRRSPRGDRMPHARDPLTVLLVDDDDLVRSAAREVLKKMGHHVTAVASGEEALDVLDFHPDVVILDMNMPGIGGAGTLPRIRALHPTLPVIISTGRVDDSVLNLTESYHNVGLLAKPYTMKLLEDRLNEMLSWTDEDP